MTASWSALQDREASGTSPSVALHHQGQGGRWLMRAQWTKGEAHRWRLGTNTVGQ